MKNILIPMDFTDVGVNALRYALNAFPDSNISVLHIKVGMLDTNEPLPLSAATLQVQYWKDAMKNFIQKELKVDTIPERVSISVEYGPIISSITYPIQLLSIELMIGIMTIMHLLNFCMYKEQMITHSKIKVKQLFQNCLKNMIRISALRLV